jgi:hypothetical protein
MDPQIQTAEADQRDQEKRAQNTERTPFPAIEHLNRENRQQAVLLPKIWARQ